MGSGGGGRRGQGHRGGRRARRTKRKTVPGGGAHDGEATAASTQGGAVCTEGAPLPFQRGLGQPVARGGQAALTAPL